MLSHNMRSSFVKLERAPLPFASSLITKDAGTVSLPSNTQTATAAPVVCRSPPQFFKTLRTYDQHCIPSIDLFEAIGTKTSAAVRLYLYAPLLAC